MIGFGSLEVGIDEIIASSLGRFQDPHAPLLRPVRYPVPILLGTVAKFIAGHPLALAVGVEEADDSLGLLERLDQPVQQQSVQAPVMEPDVILVMLEKAFMGNLQCGEIPGAYLTNAFFELKGYQGVCPK